MPQADIELVRKARYGDMDAFHELVDRHAAYLYGLALSMVGNASDAEDVVQETLTGAFRGLGSFGEQSSVKTWLTRILIRQAANHFRRSRPARRKWFRLEAAPEPAVVPATERSDLQMDLSRGLMSLSPEHREVVVLRELQGLGYEEIALALGIPRGTVESRLFRARRELQELLKGYL